MLLACGNALAGGGGVGCQAERLGRARSSSVRRPPRSTLSFSRVLPTASPLPPSRPSSLRLSRKGTPLPPSHPPILPSCHPRQRLLAPTQVSPPPPRARRLTRGRPLRLLAGEPLHLRARVRSRAGAPPPPRARAPPPPPRARALSLPSRVRSSCDGRLSAGGVRGGRWGRVGCRSPSEVTHFQIVTPTGRSTAIMCYELEIRNTVKRPSRQRPAVGEREETPVASTTPITRRSFMRAAACAAGALSAGALMGGGARQDGLQRDAGPGGHHHDAGV